VAQTKVCTDSLTEGEFAGALYVWSKTTGLKGVAAMWQTGVNLTYENN
jgi:hypothetical protein